MTKGAEDLKQYKVSGLAKEMGVSPDLLKLYEEYGLIAPRRDPGSQYRYYNIYDGGQLVSCLTLRNMGFSVRQTADALRTMDHSALASALEGRRAALEEERARLDRLIPAVEEYAAFLAEFSAPEREPLACVRPGYYFLAQSSSEEFRQTGEQKLLARRLLDELPWSERLLVLRAGALRGDGPFHFQWGLALREDRAEGWPVEALRYLPPRRCVRLMENHDAAVKVSREGFQSVITWLAAEGLAVEEDVVCRVPVTTMEGGMRTAHRAVYLPVADGKWVENLR